MSEGNLVRWEIARLPPVVEALEYVKPEKPGQDSGCCDRNQDESRRFYAIMPVWRVVNRRYHR